MEKSKLISVFKSMNFIAGFGLTALGLTVFLFGPSYIIKYMGIGMAIGVWGGILLNHYYQIPKLYKNKDERELTLMIIAISASTSFMAVVFMILFMFTSIGNLIISIQEYWVIFLSVIAITFAIRYFGYKMLDSLL
ncbi:hypothetical protein RI065_08235 [Mycoplasmatota bacterium zrk1]